MRHVQVIVLNDEHNTFESFYSALAKTIPGVDLARATLLAATIERMGQVVVWSGPRKQAKLYHAQLAGLGLTMAARARTRGPDVPLWIFYSLYYLGLFGLVGFVFATVIRESRLQHVADVVAVITLALFCGVRRARSDKHKAAAAADTKATAAAHRESRESAPTATEAAVHNPEPHRQMPLYVAGLLGAAFVGRLASRVRGGRRHPTR